MIDFAQETGRIGRDSETTRAFSFVLYEEESFRPPKHEDRFGARAMYDWVYMRGRCRRAPLGLFNDGIGTPCVHMEGQTHLCDECENESDTQQEPPSYRPPPTSLHRNVRTGQVFHVPQAPNAPFEQRVIVQSAPPIASEPVEDYAILHQQLMDYDAECVVCQILGQATESHPFESHEEWQDSYKAFKSKLEFAEGVCFNCGIPQNVRRLSDSAK
jgi:hypothetical protein